MKKSMISLVLLASSVAIAPANASWFGDLFDSTGSREAPSKTQLAEVPSSPKGQLLTANPLVDTAMSQLSLDKAQTEGGLGTILSVAKSRLSEADFSALAKHIPGADMLLAATPSLGQSTGVSDTLSQLGSSLEDGAMVYNAFDKLGIPKEMLMPMVNVLKDYLQDNSGAQSADLLSKGLSSLF